MTVTIDPVLDAEVQAFQARRSTKALDLCARAYSLGETFRQAGIEPVSIHAFTGGASVHIGESDFRKHFAGREATEVRNSTAGNCLRIDVDGIRVEASIPVVWPKITEAKVQL